MAEIYVSTDVETDGPIPGPHSMLSLASAAYRPDKTGGRTLRRVAGALEAPVFNEGDVQGIVGAIRERIGTGTQVPQGRQVVSHQLAPHALLLAFAPLVLLLYRRNISAT